MPVTSILILTKDKYLLIRECLESILSTVNFESVEVLIGDTGSGDARVFSYYEQFISRFRGRAEVHKLNYYQFSENNNQLAAKAKGDVLVFLNNDTLAVTPDWLFRLREAALKPGVAIAGAKLLYADTGRIQHAGIEFFGQGVSANPFAHMGYHIFKHRRPEMPDADYEKYVPAVTGACLAIRTEVFHRLNGFDPVFREEAQDVDLCLKAHRWGLKSVYVPTVVLYHLENGTRLRAELSDDRIHFVKKWRKYIDQHFLDRRFQSEAVDPAILAKRESVRYVLFRRSRARGDIFVSTAILKKYKIDHPETHISFKTQFPNLVDGLPFIDRVLGEEEWDDFKYDEILDLNYENGEWKKHPHSWLQEMSRSVGVTLDLAEARPQFQFSSFDEPYRRYYRKFALKRPYIAVSTGAGWRERLWAAPQWELLVRAVRERGWEVVQIGGRGDDWIESAFHLMDRDLHENLAILESAKMLVTLDSFPYHLGVAVKLPIVILTCKTSSQTVWMPEGVTEIRNSGALDTPLPGCRLVGCRTKSGEGLDNPCLNPILRELRYERVLEAVLEKCYGT
jgi:GT2 family glycosyltransferase